MRLLLAAFLAVAIATASALPFADRSIDALLSPPPMKTFAAVKVEQGATLAAVGNCIGCHTVADGMPFAGGTPIVTPFGTIYGSNITPDPQLGIGAWPELAFQRALREGVSRDGHLLYPAFPYDHFTALTDDDIGALYAYMMTRTPAHVVSRANALRFPFGFRPLLAVWKMLYFRPGTRAAASTQAKDRGAYLVGALGHCAACHSPRNALGAEDRPLAGGEVEGWYAPPLDAHSPSPLPWDVDHLTDYLRTGLAESHAMAGGPMQGVVRELAHAKADDVRAIATYIVVAMKPIGSTSSAAAASRGAVSSSVALLPAPQSDDPALAAGASLYADTCASCHELGREVSSRGALRLQLAVALYDDDPRSLIHIVRDGIVPGDGEARRWMPAFGSALDDAQLTDLLAYLRHAAAGRPPWPDLARRVEESHR